MTYARIARFTGATPQQIASTVSAIQAADGPPPGVPSTAITVVVDEQAGTVNVIGYFDSERDLHTADAALRRMDPPGGTPGTPRDRRHGRDPGTPAGVGGSPTRGGGQGLTAGAYLPASLS